MTISVENVAKLLSKPISDQTEMITKVCSDIELLYGNKFATLSTDIQNAILEYLVAHFVTVNHSNFTLRVENSTLTPLIKTSNLSATSYGLFAIQLDTTNTLKKQVETTEAQSTGTKKGYFGSFS